MIQLFTFGSGFNLPHVSPFVMKADILLKMSQLPYEVVLGDVTKAPKQKLPYIIDGEKTIADSSLIRFYLEKHYGIDFDAEADDFALPSAFMAAKYCEEHLYFLVVGSRWLNPENFEKGPKIYFEKVPSIIRGVIEKKTIKNIEKTLWLQGLGRHSEAEQIQLASKGSEMLARLLSDRQYFGGEEHPCGSDAFIAAQLCGILNNFFDCPFQGFFAEKENLVSYTKRMMAQFYPTFSFDFIV